MTMAAARFGAIDAGTAPSSQTNPSARTSAAPQEAPRAFAKAVIDVDAF